MFAGPLSQFMPDPCCPRMTYDEGTKAEIVNSMDRPGARDNLRPRRWRNANGHQNILEVLEFMDFCVVRHDSVVSIMAILVPRPEPNGKFNVAECKEYCADPGPLRKVDGNICLELVDEGDRLKRVRQG